MDDLKVTPADVSAVMRAMRLKRSSESCRASANKRWEKTGKRKRTATAKAAAVKGWETRKARMKQLAEEAAKE